MSSASHVLDPAIEPARILAELEPGVQRLVRIVSTLYGGCWDACAEDIRRRRSGKPYLYRIDLPDGIDDLTWLHRLQTYESVRGERLADASDHPAACLTAENRP